MKFVVKTAHGYLSLQPDGRLELRPLTAPPGPWETFEAVSLDPVVPIPSGGSVPFVVPLPDPALRPEDWFMALVAGKPFGQQTLLDLEPTLIAAGWQLTPPNAAGDRTKILPPRGVWTRVGFGEGVWVWKEQS